MDSITINFEKSPELKELFSRKKAGDKCEFEVTVQVNEISPDGMKGTIESITFEDDEGEEKEAEPDAEKPAMIKMEMGGKDVELETSY
jgi:hypothetical protein